MSSTSRVNLNHDPKRAGVSMAATCLPFSAIAAKPAPRRRGARLANGERKILTALAHYPQGRTKNPVGILVGYAVNGGGSNNYLSSCVWQLHLGSSANLVQVEPETQDGRNVLGWGSDGTSLEPLATRIA